MIRRLSFGLGVAGLLAATLPASAQVVDDFLCSTFSYKCATPPTPPPPVLAPSVPPASADKPVEVVRKKKKKHPAKKVAPAASDATPQ